MQNRPGPCKRCIILSMGLRVRDSCAWQRNGAQFQLLQWHSHRIHLDARCMTRIRYDTLQIHLAHAYRWLLIRIPSSVLLVPQCANADAQRLAIGLSRGQKPSALDAAEQLSLYARRPRTWLCQDASLALRCIAWLNAWRISLIAKVVHRADGTTFAESFLA